MNFPNVRLIMRIFHKDYLNSLFYFIELSHFYSFLLSLPVLSILALCGTADGGEDRRFAAGDGGFVEGLVFHATAVQLGGEVVGVAAKHLRLQLAEVHVHHLRETKCV
jgi:hypothetical protein